MNYTEEHVAMRPHARQIRQREPRISNVRRFWTLAAVASGLLCILLFLLSLLSVAWIKFQEERNAHPEPTKTAVPTSKIGVSVTPTDKDRPVTRRELMVSLMTADYEDEDHCVSCTEALLDLGECLHRSDYKEACRAERKLYKRVAGNWQEEVAAIVVNDAAALPPPADKDPLVVCVHNEECHVAFEMLMECVKVRMLNPALSCEDQKEVLRDAVKKAIAEDQEGM
ncbi:hypothetical protein UCRPA7_8847 [Phaeoacremonium minimum UCRPA7]|uniref:Uncharacterized protein n=1 Tax=Phaeoacremonium minimum (strain UCR-PA7) TaxID=1286976 RepID=R8B8J9_PHAM7|nr:hypothetical protein UCRPA7_8847 [Phaeoacremonium minimum UCRPA7]EON95626.1 hypothetical protein UCRPA7_8847 [Phaeoacremonium minimum UCRPA7]